uniref:NADH-ubiquinone oxidoreductase chain 5 n=1 Tax=Lipothrix lubbocki TaxID=1387126 RepID=A0A6H0EYN5_9HEXA|nr:NADH dehydrogenase subunit 5 [Lipothrix lubbocki]
MLMMILLLNFYLSWMLGLVSFFSFLFSLNMYIKGVIWFVEINLFKINSSSVIFLMLFDWVSTLFMSVVFFISSMVMIYMKGYMSGDKNEPKFTYLILLFVFSMGLMIMSPNLISIMLGWDGLGLVSYLLVIYYNSNKSFNCGMLTILSNRLGDICILISLAWLMNYGSVNMFYLMNMNYSVGVLVYILILAGMTKSAQIPFSAWLPAAMAAPTPVSSLVHSSTLVTAGVYLLIRFHVLIEYNYFLFFFSFLTLFMSGISAMFEFDLKKIIALSTLSQLAMMMMVLSLGFYEICFYHLLTHAMFKSLLFLCAGVFIHNMYGWQDIRSISMLSMKAPIVSIYFFFSSLSLCGFPFLTGFYSKDLMVELLYMKEMYVMIFVMVVMIMFTLIYSFRLIYYMFINISYTNSKSIMEEDSLMYTPLFFLFLFSIFLGASMMWMYFPSFFIFMEVGSKMLILLLMFISFPLIWILMVLLNSSIGGVKSSLVMMMNLPFLSSVYFVKTMGLGLLLIKQFDQGWLEKFSGQGGSLKFKSWGGLIDKINLMNMKMYLLLFMYTLILLILMF